MPEQEIGMITHWWSHLSVAGITLASGALKQGDTIHVKGHTTDLTFAIQEMQVNHQTVAEAKAGDDIALKVPDHVRIHDKVYKVTA